MSHAIVMYPSIVPLLVQLAPVLVPVLAFIVIQGVLNQLTEKATNETCATAALQRDAHLKFVGEELGKAFSALQEACSQRQLSARGRLAIDQEFSRLEGQQEKFLKKMSGGKILQEDISRLREEMDAFSLRTAQEEARCQEDRHRFHFLQERFQRMVVQAAPAVQEAARVREKEMLDIPEMRVEDRISALEKMIADTEKTLDRQVFQNLLAKITGVAGDSHTGRSAPIPGSPPVPVKKEEIVMLLRARQDILYFMSRFEEEFPQEVTGSLKGLTDEAAGSDFFGRVKAIRDEVKLTFQKHREQRVLTEFFREKLLAGLALVGSDGDLGKRLSQALSHTVIEREVFTPLFGAIEHHLTQRVVEQKRRVVEQKVREELARLDYVVMSSSMEQTLAGNMAQGKITLVDTKYDDYKIMVKLADDDALSARLVRIVSDARDRDNITEVQAQRDRDLVTEWCGNLDAFLENMRQGGVVMVEQIRLEQKVDYFTIEQLEQAKIEVSELKVRRAEVVKQTQKKQIE